MGRQPVRHVHVHVHMHMSNPKTDIIIFMVM